MCRNLSIVLLAVSTLCATPLQSQVPTWSEDIAELIYENCSGCHHLGGIAPFELMTYAEMVIHAPFIYESVDHREMPPWPADPDYRHFANETYLEDFEITLIKDWIDGGTPLGDPTLAPDPPVYLPSGSLLDTIDYVVEIEPYTLQTNSDEYRWFAIPTSFTDTVYISRIEVMAGLEDVVHHADLSYDLTGNTMAFDLSDPLPGFNNSTGAPTISYYINAWQPGGGIARYPTNWGIAVPPGADFVVEIHYGPGGLGLTDSTYMNLEFIRETTDVRQVQSGWLLYDSPPVLLDGPLVLPANQVSTFHQRSSPISTDLSLLAICPHMHFLGKSYKVWATTPAGDTIPLIDIPHWDFHWQKYYFFQRVQKLPAGSVLHSVGVYDNTSANHDNPNIPPITVYRGARTIDEMFLTYFIFTGYEEGDEFILQDSSLLSTSSETIPHVEKSLLLYPNPASESLTVMYETASPELVQFRVIDILGRPVNAWRKEYASSILSSFRIDLSGLPDGLYHLEWISESGKGTESFFKR